MTIGQGLDVATIAQQVLAAVVDQFTAAGVLLPDRRIIAPGAPEAIAWDCEQLVVTMQGIGIGPAPSRGTPTLQAGRQMSAIGLRHVVLAVQLVRCTPESTNAGRNPPSATTITDAALALMRDAGLISQAMVQVCTAVVQGLPRGTQCEAGAVNPIGPDGALVGLQTSVAVTAGTLT